MELHEFYIAGRWITAEGAGRQPIISPSTGEAIGSVALATSEEVDHAVSAASAAFNSWACAAVAERRSILKKVAAAYRNRRSDLSRAMTLEMGAPKSLAEGPQSGAGLGHLEDFVAAMNHVNWENALSPGDANNRIILEPMGVAALITPWNWPMNQIALKVGAALAAGCTVVLKPSELAPLSARIFAEIMDEAGAPPGVFNMIFGTGPEAGEALASHPQVAAVSLTGSTRAGVAVTHAAADTVKRVSLELGGKGACLIFEDADPVDAAQQTARAMFRNSGQSCNAPSRMLVERSVYETALQAAADAAREIILGAPDRDDTEMGPLANRAQYERVIEMIRAGTDEGARLVIGGAEPQAGLEKGFYISPTIFADANNRMRIAREEIFGPVLTIMPFDSEDEAVAIANDSPYGLAAYLWTSDAARTERVSRRLRSGMVRLNGTDLPFGAPFGGYGQSGIGREGGVWGIEEFLEVKAVSGWPGEA